MHQRTRNYLMGGLAAVGFGIAGMLWYLFLAPMEGRTDDYKVDCPQVASYPRQYHYDIEGMHVSAQVLLIPTFVGETSRTYKVYMEVIVTNTSSLPIVSVHDSPVFDILVDKPGMDQKRWSQQIPASTISYAWNLQPNQSAVFRFQNIPLLYGYAQEEAHFSIVLNRPNLPWEKQVHTLDPIRLDTCIVAIYS